MQSDFLIEIGCEEIPAPELDRALAGLPALLGGRLDAARLAHGEVRVWGSPRRLAALVRDLAGEQADLTEELRGPPVQVAFDADGKPTKAGEKFAEKVGQPLDALERLETPKGTYLVGTRTEPGRPAREVLPEICRDLLASIGFRKPMRWPTPTEAAPDRDSAFVRPVRWLVCLLGGEALPFEFAGQTAGAATRGHRFVHPEPLPLAEPGAYLGALEKVQVLADPAERRARIEAQIAALEAEHGVRVVPDPELVHEVAHLVEWPTAVLGTFDPSFLEVPRPVIISAMRGHQRYFATEKPGEPGVLSNHFVTVLGTPVRDLDVAVRGNQRVLAARLADARFFWREDLKTPLAEHAAGLEQVVFQKDLGSVADKVGRVARLAADLAEPLGADAGTVAQAAALAKADLVTHMVGEFPDLQGVVGERLARAQGLPGEVAAAIAEHYLPRGASDALPPSAAGAALAIADRLDTIAGCVGAGLKPKGGGDAFGLRRAALGVLRIVLDRGLQVSLADWVRRACAVQDTVAPDAAEVLTFLLDRLRHLLGDEAPAEVVGAVFSAGGDDPLELRGRVRAVRALQETAEYEALATTFRRMNILKQADVSFPDEPSPEAFTEEAARVLYEALGGARREVEAHLGERAYEAALAALVALRPAVDRFFDEARVLAPEPEVKANRLALLGAVDRLLRRIADFKMIAG